MSRMKLKREDNIVYFTAQCQPEMKSGSDYRMRMAVYSTPSVDPDLEDAVVERFLFTDCTCPAGKGPHATCKHLSALLYALEKFCRKGYVRESITCTSRLQQWNQPRKKNEKVMKLTDMDWNRPSLSKECFQAKSCDKRTASDLTDPRAMDKRGGVQQRVNAVAKEHVDRGAVTGLVLVCGSEIFADEVKNQRLARRDRKRQEWLRQHADAVDSDGNGSTDSESNHSVSGSEDGCAPTVPRLPVVTEARSSVDACYKKHVVVDQAAAAALEKATREQSNSPAWFSARRLRITATSSKAIVCRQKQDVSKLLHRMLHSSFHGSAATRYGDGQEEQATEDYCRARPWA